MTEENTYMKKLMKQLVLGSRRCAKRIVKEEGQPDREEYFLTTLSNMTDVQYLHPTNFVEELNVQGKIIDATTLQIIDAGEKQATKPDPEPKLTLPVTEPEPATEATTPDAKELPEEIEIWSEPELAKMSYSELRAAAKIDPVVPGNVSTDEMRRQLLGRPKSFG